jgi:hypothetical protein
MQQQQQQHHYFLNRAITVLLHAETTYYRPILSQQSHNHCNNDPQSQSKAFLSSTFNSETTAKSQHAAKDIITKSSISSAILSQI